jgi:hypothetical protein
MRESTRKHGKGPFVFVLNLCCVLDRSAVIFGPDDTPWEGGVCP